MTTRPVHDALCHPCCREASRACADCRICVTACRPAVERGGAVRCEDCDRAVSSRTVSCPACQSLGSYRPDDPRTGGQTACAYEVACRVCSGAGTIDLSDVECDACDERSLDASCDVWWDGWKLCGLRCARCRREGRRRVA